MIEGLIKSTIKLTLYIKIKIMSLLSENMQSDSESVSVYEQRNTEHMDMCVKNTIYYFSREFRKENYYGAVRVIKESYVSVELFTNSLYVSKYYEELCNIVDAFMRYGDIEDSEELQGPLTEYASSFGINMKNIYYLNFVRSFHLNDTEKMETNRQMYVQHSDMRENEANATLCWRIRKYDQAIQYLSEEVKSIENVIAIVCADEETSITNEFILECGKLRCKMEEYAMEKNLFQDLTFWGMNGRDHIDYADAIYANKLMIRGKFSHHAQFEHHVKSSY